MADALKARKRTSLLTGATLTVSLRWSDRVVGVVSTLILARLLTPSDFGLVAMASVVVGLIDVVLDLGVNLSLIHNERADEYDFNTAWTLRLLQASIAAVLVAGLAPLASNYYHDVRITSILQVMALSILIGGLENIGLVALQKNMEFGREFWFFFFKRISSFMATILLAWWLRSYWALVWGSFITRIIGVALSYILHEFRPRPCFARFQHIWSFSQWVLLRNIGAYLMNRFDKLLAGNWYNTGTVGAYSLAGEISALPTTEILGPLGRVLLPAFVEAKSSTNNIRRAYHLAMGIQVLFAMPVAVGLSIIAKDAVPILLGPKWAEVIPLLQVLAIANAVAAIGHSGGYLLLATGKVRIAALNSWIQVFMFGCLALGPFSQTNAQNLALLRFAVALFGLLFYQYLIIRVMPFLRSSDIISVCWRPTIATFLMAIAEYFLPWPDLPGVLLLLAKVLVGVFVYSLTLIAAWRLTNRPDAPEAFLLAKLKTAIHVGV